MTVSAGTVAKGAAGGRARSALPDLLLPEVSLPQRGSAGRAALLTLGVAFIFQPLLRPAGPGNSSPVDILTLAAIVVAAIWAGGTHIRLRAPYCIPVALMVGAGALSGLAGPLPGTALLTLAIDMLLFAWCTAVVNVTTRTYGMRVVLACWGWSGICWAIVCIVSWAAHITALEGLVAADGNRVLFTFGDPNYASTYWVTTIFVIYASRTPASRWLRWAGYALLVWALALSESNGGMLSLVVGIAFLALVRLHARWGWPGVGAATAALALCVYGFFAAVPLPVIQQWAVDSGQAQLVNSIGRSGQSIAERQELIEETFQLYDRGSGLLGWGPASTKPLLAELQYPYSNEAHDDYLAGLVERGPVGAFGVVLLFGSAFLWAVPIVRRRLSPGFAAVVPRPLGLVAGLLALSLNAFYEEILHFRFLWALFAIVAVLGKDAREAERPR